MTTQEVIDEIKLELTGGVLVSISNYYSNAEWRLSLRLTATVGLDQKAKILIG